MASKRHASSHVLWHDAEIDYTQSPFFPNLYGCYMCQLKPTTLMCSLVVAFAHTWQPKNVFRAVGSHKNAVYLAVPQLGLLHQLPLCILPAVKEDDGFLCTHRYAVRTPADQQQLYIKLDTWKQPRNMSCLQSKRMTAFCACTAMQLGLLQTTSDCASNLIHGSSQGM